MEDTRRFFFLHLQKTGGTALWRRLQGHFPASALYPGPGDGQPPATVLSVEHLLERWRLRHHEIRVVTGHFPLCTTELLDVPFTTFTLLRDPVERTLSYLRHHRAMTPSESERSLEEVYADPVRFELLHNHMVKMLGLTAGEMTEGALTHIRFSRDRLDQAKQRLREIDVVGLQEDFDRFCAELTARFGWDLGPPVFMNRTAPVEVSAAFRARIATENELDVELFEFARELVAGRDLSAPYNTTGI
jgi:hypothetical protein